jgi:hypothetical protein
MAIAALTNRRRGASSRVFLSGALAAWMAACSTNGGSPNAGADSGNADATGASATGSRSSATGTTSASSAAAAGGSAASTSAATTSAASSSATTIALGDAAIDPSVGVDDQSGAAGQISLTAVALPDGATRGSWFTYGADAVSGAALSPAPGQAFEFTTFDGGPFPRGACVSSAASGGAFAGEGFNLATVTSDAAPAPIATPLNLSAFTGFTFWAISSQTMFIRVRVPDDQTFGADPSALCHDPDAGGACDDDFADDFVPLGTGWTQILVNFLNLSQNSFGAPFSALDVQNVFGVKFEIEGVPEAGIAPFQFCVAQIAFTQP